MLSACTLCAILQAINGQCSYKIRFFLKFNNLVSNGVLKFPPLRSTFPISTLQRIQVNISTLQRIQVNFSTLQRIQVNISTLQLIQANISTLQLIQTNISTLQLIQANISTLQVIQANAIRKKDTAIPYSP